MDLDVVEGRFSSYFPLPYRVAIIINIGIWAWATSLHFISSAGIDPTEILHPRVPTDDHPLAALPHHLNRRNLYTPVYSIAIILTSVTCASLTIFWKFTSGDASAVISYEVLPLTCFASIFILALCPFNICYKDERMRFLRVLRRILVGGLDREGKFGDVMLADILTSYAKVLGDLWVTGCMFLGGISAAGKPDRACGGKLAVPLVIRYIINGCVLMSLPYLIRLRQCFIEFSRARGSGTQHLLNALKYASAFPVILLSAMQRTYISPVEDKYPDKVWFGEMMLFRLWILFVIINSVYSFWWDVVMDWNLTILTNPSSPGPKLWGLRKIIHFPSPQLYYTAIALDFLLRMTWSVKLSPHLHHVNELEGGIFFMETLEVIRRWIWIFFRFEAEWSKLSNVGPETGRRRGNSIPALELTKVNSRH